MKKIAAIILCWAYIFTALCVHADTSGIEIKYNKINKILTIKGQIPKYDGTPYMSVKVSGNDIELIDDTEVNAKGFVNYEKKITLSDNYKTRIVCGEYDYTDTSHYRTNVINIYVSPTGKDDADGTEEKPYKSINAAKNKVVEIRNSSDNPEIHIILQSGEYNFFETQQIDAEWGSGGKIIIESKETNRAIIKGTKNINIVPESINDDIKRRLRREAAEKIICIDLAAQGFTKEELTSINDERRPEEWIYLNGEMQRLSRYPNTGYLKLGEVTEAENGIKFSYDDQRPDSWTKASDSFAVGYMANDWNGEWISINYVDAANKTIALEKNAAYKAKSGKRWAAVNVLEEIDIPGEWYLDMSSLKLYYYPPRNLNTSDIFEVAAFNKPTISIQCDNVEIRNIECKMVRSEGIVIKNSNEVVITDCYIHDIGKNGIVITGSKNTSVANNRIYNVGENGIRISGSMYENGNNVIKGNNIFNVSTKNKNNSIVGVKVDDCKGVSILNNIIHGTPGPAIRYSGADTTIQYNEIYNVINETFDAAVIYSWNSLLQYGADISYNYIHNFGMQNEESTDGYFASAIYWDEKHSGNTAKYNIIAAEHNNYSGGIYSNGGRDNKVYGNIIANTKYGLGLMYWGGIVSNEVYNSLKEYPYNQSTDKTDYSSISEIIADIDKDDKKLKPYNTEAQGNLLFNTNLGTSNISGAVHDNWEISDDSIFNDASNGDYRVTKIAKQNLGLNGILDEEFDISQVGEVKTDEAFCGEFSLYSTDLSDSDYRDVSLVWEKSVNADIYECIIASDAEFNNEVCRVSTSECTVNISGLKADGLYYWKVIAKNNSRNMKSFQTSTNIGTIKTCANDMFINSVKAFSEADNLITNGVLMSGKIKLVLNVTNNKEENNSHIYMAMYSENGVLTDLHEKEFVIKEGQNEYSVDFDISKRGTLKSCAKVYIFDGEGRMIPLAHSENIF